MDQVILSGCYEDIGWFKKASVVEKTKLNQLLNDLELDHIRHRQIAELSGGQLQRVLVARALMSNSDIYCLDEPFVGIDIYSEADQYFDRILLLNQSLQFLGPTKEALSSERLNATFINYKDDSLLTLSSQGSTN